MSAVCCDIHLQTVPPTPSEIDDAPVASVRQKSPPGYKVFASPATKHLAKENSINLAVVTGTGPEGRITRGGLPPYV
jgi:pyruvate/2-oxoglutarate dehydrogenase complex dihydrolipoamide acyltransferase (E2) component